MTLKTLLVCLTTQENAERLMSAAVTLARQHSAHLIGLHTIEALMVYPGIAMHVPGPAFSEFNASQKAQAAAIEEIFARATRNEDFPSEWRLLKTESASAADRMVESARTADLVIMAQQDRATDRYDQRHAQTRVIRECGRPVLVVPEGYSGAPLGPAAVIGWSGTREAARAAHDAIPLLAVQEGAEAHIVTVGGKESDVTSDTAAELATVLDRHGIAAQLVRRSYDGQSVSQILNREAMEKGAGLIVTGAYGHSRSYDFVIGAATTDLLDEAAFPVLFSK